MSTAIRCRACGTVIGPGAVYISTSIWTVQDYGDGIGFLDPSPRPKFCSVGCLSKQLAADGNAAPVTSPKPDDGGPAYPFEHVIDGQHPRCHPGMSVRMWLAGQALQAIIEKQALTGMNIKAEAAEALLYADALIAAAREEPTDDET